MKIYKFTLIIFGLLLTLNSYAQASPENPDVAEVKSISYSLGIGTANYYGDLMKKSGVFKQTSAPAISVGASYNISEKFNFGINIGYQKLQGADYKSGGAHLDRNLDFKSNVFEFTAFGEFVAFPDWFITPVISAGFGVMTFDPFTQDATGKKVSLRELGTEGQGLPGNKGLYGKSTWVAPVGLGVRYELETFPLAIVLDYKYHFTGTDYLDDVSMNGYPDKVLLDANNPLTSQFTYRGAGAYPKNLALPRGNPNAKDGFYTFQLKFIFTPSK